MSEVDDIAQIGAAFAARARPDDEAIVDRGPRAQGTEPERAWQAFHGRTWQEMVEVGRKQSLREEMGFLTQEGFLYYLPAFLVLAYDDDQPFDLDETLASYLWTRGEQVAERLAPLEKRAVVQTLEHLSRVFEHQGFVRNDAQTALEQYWAYFTDAELGR
jgi:hypothetical protein